MVSNLECGEMTTLEALLAGIASEPLEETRWLVLADWLEENDDPLRAELLRLHRRLLATCCKPANYPERVVWHTRLVELLGAGVRPCIPQERLLLKGSVEMMFSFIPAGEFLMGSKAHSTEKPVHRVKMTKDFYLGMYPVTQAQWKAVMGTEPSHFKGADRPVENVSRIEAVKLCKKMSAYFNGRAEIRLPTETEWEYACRAGTTTEFNSGNGEAAIQAVGWYRANSNEETHPVGKLVPNAWNLHDMHGNVQEWCDDNPKDYALDKQDDPVDNVSPSIWVFRGGSYQTNDSLCRSAARGGGAPWTRANDLGFRVALLLNGDQIGS
jgi:uncharacterized protein (TIGR02996 family)